MKVTGTDGRQGFSYDTLAEIQANTRLEDRSMALPPAKWTDGTLFRRFVGQTSDDFDFQPADGVTSLNICAAQSRPVQPELAPRPSNPSVIADAVAPAVSPGGNMGSNRPALVSVGESTSSISCLSTKPELGQALTLATEGSSVKRSILAFIGSLCLLVPALIKAVTYTHFVTPNGSATSLCTQQEPCNLTRAVALIGSKDMAPGSTVLVQRGADGIYSQASLTLAGSGAADNPIKFIGENGVRITGTRVKPDPSAWTLVPGRRYTYQLDWDEAAQFPALPVQRPPVANWRPIWVEDRRPPFTTPSTRRFDIWFPPLYSARTSIDEVEAQAGTAWHDTANNKLYVHLFDDTAPPASRNEPVSDEWRLGHADHQRRLHLAGEPDHRTRHARGPSGQHLRERHRPQANHRAGVQSSTCVAPTRWPRI